MNPKDLSLFHLIRPSKNTGAKASALFLLHGYGSNEEDLFSFAPELPEELCIISIRAPFALQPFGYAWYSIHFDAPQGKWNDVQQAGETRERLRSFIGEAVEAYNLDENHINLLGFSQGSILSYALALSYPKQFRSVVALSGYIDQEMLLAEWQKKDHSALEVYASHGQLDPVIPISWAQQSADFLARIDLKSFQFREFPVGHGVSAENFRDFKNWLSRLV
jgi:phospholipase/carboxylesterase